VADVEDAIETVKQVARLRLIDIKKVAIRGHSAGKFPLSLQVLKTYMNWQAVTLF
jgi:hypothetical protein